MIITHDPAVQAAIIQSAGSILAALIAALAAAIIGRQISGRKKLEEHLTTAKQDIAFLLAVEEAHGHEHVSLGGSPGKIRIRKIVRATGLTWSGRFTPGRVRSEEGLGEFIPPARLAPKAPPVTKGSATDAIEVLPAQG